MRLEGHDVSKTGYSLGDSWFTSILPFFLAHTPFEPQLKLEIVYQDYYPWWNSKSYFGSPTSERLSKVQLNLSAAYLMWLMFLSTWIQAQIPTLGLWVLQDWVSFILCPPIPTWVQIEQSLRLQVSGRIALKTNPHTCKPQLTSSLLSGVILQGRPDSLQANRCSCQPHKLGNKGRAVKGEMFYCPHFQRQFPRQSRWVITKIRNQLPVCSPPSPWISSCSGGLYPTRKVTSFLRNMQSRLWAIKERTVGDRCMSGSWVSLRIG